MSACTTPFLRSSTCLGPASKPTIFTLPSLPASRTPVAAPSAENRLVAKMPLRSGFLASAALVTAAAFAASSSSYSWPTYVRPSSLAPSAKPLPRASVVEMPGLTLTTKTLPLPPMSFASAAAAALPPPSLSEAICDTAMSG
jgi:hypothetical protein